jgi:hypothetical protein
MNISPSELADVFAALMRGGDERFRELAQRVNVVEDQAGALDHAQTMTGQRLQELETVQRDQLARARAADLAERIPSKYPPL